MPKEGMAVFEIPSLYQYAKVSQVACVENIVKSSYN